MQDLKLQEARDDRLGILIILNLIDYKVGQYGLVADNYIMHQPFIEGRVGYKLVKVYDEYNHYLEPIHIFLKRLLRVLDDFKETIGPFWVMPLQRVSLYEPGRQICEGGYTMRWLLLEPCDRSFI